MTREQQAEQIHRAQAWVDNQPGMTTPAVHIANLLEIIAALRSSSPVQETSGIGLITTERQRQMTAEGWTPEHDDAHDKRELVYAAIRYASPMPTFHFWPWEEAWWKPSDDPIRNLVKAGALIAAEIDRLQRRSPVQERVIEQERETDHNGTGLTAGDAVSVLVPTGQLPHDGNSGK